MLVQEKEPLTGVKWCSHYLSAAFCPTVSSEAGTSLGLVRGHPGAGVYQHMTSGECSSVVRGHGFIYSLQKAIYSSWVQLPQEKSHRKYRPCLSARVSRGLALSPPRLQGCLGNITSRDHHKINLLVNTGASFATPKSCFLPQNQAVSCNSGISLQSPC